jgi:ribosome-associated protein
MSWGCTLAEPTEPQGRTLEANAATAPAEPVAVALAAAAELAVIQGYARRIAEVASDKLAEDIVILDMTGVSSFTDFFIICSGRNSRQTKGIYEEIYHRLKQESRLIPRAIAGERESEWIVIDYVDIVVHIFTPELRSFYRLEDLWGDVPRVAFDATDAA